MNSPRENAALTYRKANQTAQRLRALVDTVPFFQSSNARKEADAAEAVAAEALAAFKELKINGFVV